MTADGLRLSVIMPAKDAERLLPQSLNALLASDLSRDQWELIVVDDGSTDRTGITAAGFADTVIRLPGRPQGPAYARNRGFEVSRGQTIVFVDADVCVRRDTLSRFVHRLESEPDVGALFGSYDAQAPATGVLSQYQNLLHHYQHQTGGGDVDWFWSGCGAVRRSVFTSAGMYDEWHSAKRQEEGIELGHRIRGLGHRVLLCPELLCTHLKRWTIGEVFRADIQQRGTRWARTAAGRSRTAARATRSETLITLLVWGSVIGAIAGTAGRWPAVLAGAAAMLVLAVGLALPLHRFFWRQRGALFALAAIWLRLVHHLLNGVYAVLGLVFHETFGGPTPDPTIDAYAEVGVKRWPPVPSKRGPP